jgi:hypothetical protein
VKLAIPQSARSNALLPHTNACCAAAAALSIWTNVGAADSGVYPVPSLDGYVLERTRFLDKNKQPDGKKETLVEIYSAGDQYLLRYSTKGQDGPGALSETPPPGPTIPNRTTPYETAMVTASTTNDTSVMKSIFYHHGLASYGPPNTGLTPDELGPGRRR